MPSAVHEILLMLFRNGFTLLSQSLSDSSKITIPQYNAARIDSADFNDVQPTEYRADLVITLVADDGSPVMSFVVEAQMSRDERKRFVWPVYAVTLRARLKCPVCVLVVTLDESVARWAPKPIELGGESRFVPLIFGPSQIAQVTDVVQARASPELAVLSVMAHSKSADVQASVKIARAALDACAVLESDPAKLYRDIVYRSLSNKARQEVQSMDTEQHESWAECFEREMEEMYTARAMANGRLDIIRRQLMLRFGTLPWIVESKIGHASADELNEIGERLLTAETLEQAVILNMGRRT
jgi:hypothetical protein